MSQGTMSDNHKSQLLALAFDLDGTLIDSHEDIAQAVNHALQRSGRRPLDAHVITSFVGDGYKKLLERATGLDSEAPELGELGAVFLEYYATHATVFTTLYPGVRETLDLLAQRFTLALCTNKPRVTTEAVLRELELGRYFSVVVAGDDLAQRKPDPSPLLHIARALEVRPEQMAMIGDGPQDIECGRAAGTLCIGVAFGMKPPDATLASGPHHVVSRFADLIDLCS